MKAKKLTENNEHCDENDYTRDDEIKLNFSEDYRYFGGSPIGVLIQSKYCKCGSLDGRIRTSYEERLFPPTYGMKAAGTAKHYGACNKSAAHDVYELDKGAFYLTKKSLMLNQFLEYKNDTWSPAVNHANDVVANRFNKSGDNGKCHLKSPARFNVVQVPQNNTTTTTASATTARTLCLPSSVFCDKRLVSLFRSVALYWFFCLNTVLAKGDLFKKKTLSAFELQKHNPSGTLASNLQLQIYADIFENFVDDSSSSDFLWNVLLKEAETVAEAIATKRSGLLVYAEHSKEKLFDDLFKKVLLNMADTNGIFVAANGASSRNSSNTRKSSQVSDSFKRNSAAATGSSKRNASRKYALDVFDDEYLDGAFYSRVVWKKRSVKNKQKSKRKHEATCRGERVQEEIIIECVDDGRYADDGFEEVTAAAVQKQQTAVPGGGDGNVGDQEVGGSGDSGYEDVFVDFDSYVRDLKRQEEAEKKADAETARVSNVEAQVQVADRVTDSYFLPDGMLNVEERDYPEYDLWCSPLIGEEVLPTKSAREPPPEVKVAEPSPATFKPYSLWKSSFSAVEEDYIPNFEAQRYFSVFSKSYYPPEKRREPRKEPSAYNLWGSPNIIEVLQVGSADANECTTSRSSSSSESTDREYPTSELFEQVLKTRRHQNTPHLARGKFLNFKPVVNGFVSFTDRGAFKYYRKTDNHRRAEPDVEAKNAAVATPPQNEQEAYFKPIQPAIKVETDMPANFERSESGTLYYQNRKLMTYKHETDYRSRFADLFQPKFTVSANDVACQTDRFGYASVGAVGCHRARYQEQAGRSYAANGHKKTTPEPHVSGATFFYSLEEVFNFLGKPGLGNIDVKAHVDFSCMF